MKTSIPVSEIMTPHVYTIEACDSLYRCQEMFHKFKIRHLPVTEQGNLVGMLSLTDIMRLSFGPVFDQEDKTDNAVFEMLNIDQVMKHQPFTVKPSDTVQEVAEIFTKQEFHALPVVQEGELVGIVTTTDVIKYLLQVPENRPQA